MEIILEKTVPKLGIVGEVVKVADGYARNFLLPKGLAVAANKHNLEVVKNRVKKVREEELKSQDTALSVAKQLKDIKIDVEVKASEEGKLFGSVGEAEIVQGLKEKGFEIDKKCVDLKEHFKHLGVYDVHLKLHPMVQLDIKVWVIREPETKE